MRLGLVRTLDNALQMPEGISRDDFFDRYCPPLPQNFEPQQEEPEAIQFLLNQLPSGIGSHLKTKTF